mgnify:CR=1 FL=1
MNLVPFGDKLLFNGNLNNNGDLEFLYTLQCKVRNFSYEFAVLSKNKIQLFFLYFPLFLLVFMILIFLEFCDILNMLIIKKSANILF